MTGQLVGTASIDQSGGFLFTGLNPGSYVVEIVNAQGVITSTSAVSTLAAGATVTIALTAGTAAATAGGGLSTLVIVSMLAAAAGVAAVVIAVNRGTASPSQ
jgi:hypothetical protein